MTRNDKLKKVAEQHVRRFALFYHYIAREVVETLGEEQGKMLIKKAVKEFGRTRGKAIRRRVEKAGLDPNLKNFKAFYDLPLGLTHESTNVKISTEQKSWREVRGCLFFEIMKELGSEDLGALYCEQDKALAEAYNDEISFTRIQTALTGGECCETVLEIP